MDSAGWADAVRFDEGCGRYCLKAKLQVPRRQPETTITLKSERRTNKNSTPIFTYEIESSFLSIHGVYLLVENSWRLWHTNFTFIQFMSG